MSNPAHPYYDPAKAHHLPDGFTNRHGARGGHGIGEEEFALWRYGETRIHERR